MICYWPLPFYISGHKKGNSSIGSQGRTPRIYPCLGNFWLSDYATDDLYTNHMIRTPLTLTSHRLDVSELHYPVFIDALNPFKAKHSQTSASSFQASSNALPMEIASQVHFIISKFQGNKRHHSLKQLIRVMVVQNPHMWNRAKITGGRRRREGLQRKASSRGPQLSISTHRYPLFPDPLSSSSIIKQFHWISNTTKATLLHTNKLLLLPQSSINMSDFARKDFS